MNVFRGMDDPSAPTDRANRFHLLDLQGKRQCGRHAYGLEVRLRVFRSPVKVNLLDDHLRTDIVANTLYRKKVHATGFRVICFGGSAGGLQAYVAILRRLPVNTGMSFVVAPHRGLQYAELLPRVLSRVAFMPVEEVEEGMQLSRNRIFLMPPRKNMTLAGDRFRLHAAPLPAGWPKTTNVFLFSLAQQVGHLATAVILSGLDGDGSAALKAIKAASGTTFAQSDAAYPDMPLHAIETGHVDFWLPAAKIAEALVNLTKA